MARPPSRTSPAIGRPEGRPSPDGLRGEEISVDRTAQAGMVRTGFFSGSFDPMTNGHLDVIEHAAALCDRLVIGVGSNPNKEGLFTIEERLELIREAAGPIVKQAGCALEVVSFTGLSVEAARAAGATLIVRGLRELDRLQLRDADGRHERRYGAGAADRLPALVLPGEADHRDARAPDRLDGWRRFPLRPAERGCGAEGEVRRGREAGRVGGRIPRSIACSILY